MHGLKCGEDIVKAVVFTNDYNDVFDRRRCVTVILG